MQVVENVQSMPDTLTQQERELAEKLYKERYATDEWNLNAKTTMI
jgi:lipoate-protein ligase A